MYRQGLPDDCHLALLSDLSALRDLLSRPLLQRAALQVRVREAVASLSSLAGKRDGGAATHAKRARAASTPRLADLADLADKLAGSFAEFPLVRDKSVAQCEVVVAVAYIPQDII